MNVLAIVNGFGLGNATRCEPLLMELARTPGSTGSVRIDVATSGNGLSYFSGRSYVRHLFELRSISYGSGDAKTGITSFAMFAAAPRTMATYFANVRAVMKILSKERYDMVVIDSDYTALVFRLFTRVPVVAVNNAEFVIEECRRLRPPANTWPQFLVELFDHVFHRFVPTLTLAPTPTPTREKPKGRIVPIPLLSRFTSDQKRTTEPSRPFRVLFMFSASQLGPDPNEFVELCPRDVVTTRISRENRANPDGTFRDVTSEIRAADLIVSNAGLGTIGDAIAARTPILVVPIKGHCEQWTNARMVERLGIGEAATHDTFAAKMQMIRDDYESYRDALDGLAPRQDFAPRLAVSVIFRRLALGETMHESSESHRRVAVEPNV